VRGGQGQEVLRAFVSRTSFRRPYYRKAREAGTVEGGRNRPRPAAGGLRAAGMRLPCMPSAHGLGTV